VDNFYKKIVRIRRLAKNAKFFDKLFAKKKLEEDDKSSVPVTCKM